MLLIFTLTFAVRTAKSAETLPKDESAKILPEDVWERIMESTLDPELGSLSRVSRRMREVSEDKMKERKEINDQRVAEKEQLVNELERFRAKTAPMLRRYFTSRMNVREEIEHYLNGFDLRMYEWMVSMHRNLNGAKQKKIEEFATKLAHHRATYPREPPHRRGNQEEMPKFDAFIRMRDDNMEILQNRMRKDHIMFDYQHSRDPSSLCLEYCAMIEMMKIMETIGIAIDYPGVREMQKDTKKFGFS